MRHKRNRALAAVSAALLAASVTVSPQAGAEVIVPGTPFDGRPSAISGDFDGDGQSDIALAGADEWLGLAVAARTSSGFDVMTTLAHEFGIRAANLGATISSGQRLVTGDYNQDGADDILLTRSIEPDTLPIAESRMDGTFRIIHAPAGPFPTLAATVGAQVVSGDFNGDEVPDLALAGGAQWTTIPVALSTATGTFTVTNLPAPQFAQQAALPGVRVFDGDFDGDGRTDIAVLPDPGTAPSNFTFAVALSNGDGTFRQSSIPMPEFAGHEVIAGSFGTDSRTDLAVVLADRILVAHSRGDGTFDVYQAGASPVFLEEARRQDARIVSGDYNCDGRTDLVAMPEPDTNSGWMDMPVAMPVNEDMFNVTNEQLPHFQQSAGIAGAQVLVGDYNDDGCDDLAVTGSVGFTTIPIAISDGDGTFTEENPAAANFAAWASGTASLQPLPPVKPLPPTPATTLGEMSIMDKDVNSGITSSAAVGTDGRGIIAYYVSDPHLRNLRVAHCVDVACTAVTTTDIDTDGDVGKFPFIKIGSDGLPLITYVAVRNSAGDLIEDLKVAHCNNVACTSATKTSYNTAFRVNDQSPITIGLDGLALIAYQLTDSAITTRIPVMHCENIACTSKTEPLQSVAGGADNGESGGYSRVGLAFGGNELGMFSFYNGHEQAVRMATCNNRKCTSRQVVDVDKAANPATESLGGYLSMTVGLDGLALIAYTSTPAGSSRAQLKVAHCSNIRCTESTRTTVDNGVAGGAKNTSIAIGGDGLGVISYYDETNHDLKLAHCANLTCSAFTTTAVDAFGEQGLTSSVSIGADGLPLISYQGEGVAGTALRVVRCGNPACTAPIVAPF